jgi:hypothetical protein
MTHFQCSRGNCKTRAAHTFLTRLPLTPALSPRERESFRQIVGETHAFRNSTEQPELLPRLWGEGWGEGNWAHLIYTKSGGLGLMTRC